MKRKIKIQSISAWSIGIALILTVVFVVILHYGKNEVKRFEDANFQTGARSIWERVIWPSMS